METRSCSRWTSSPSARSRVITPSSCPVITGSCSLDSRSKVSPRSGSAIRSLIGRLSSISSTTSRRLAASASAKAGQCGIAVVGSGAGQRARPAQQRCHRPAPASCSPRRSGWRTSAGPAPAVVSRRSEHGEIPLLPGRSRWGCRSSGRRNSRRPAVGRSSDRQSRAWCQFSRVGTGHLARSTKKPSPPRRISPYWRDRADRMSRLVTGRSLGQRASADSPPGHCRNAINLTRHPAGAGTQRGRAAWRRIGCEIQMGACQIGATSTETSISRFLASV